MNPPPFPKVFGLAADLLAIVVSSISSVQFPYLSSAGCVVCGCFVILVQVRGPEQFCVWVDTFSVFSMVYLGVFLVFFGCVFVYSCVYEHIICKVTFIYSKSNIFIKNLCFHTIGAFCAMIIPAFSRIVLCDFPE